jgi:hypothetical protein
LITHLDPRPEHEGGELLAHVHLGGEHALARVLVHHNQVVLALTLHDAGERRPSSSSSAAASWEQQEGGRGRRRREEEE